LIKSAYLLKSFIGPVCVAAIPKCGQHTLSALSYTLIEPKKIPDFSVRLAFVRDPLERLRSCFHFYLDSRFNISGERIRSYSQFIDWALESQDEHVVPQADFIAPLFNTVISIRDMSSTLSRLTGRKVLTLNKSSRFDVDSSYRLEDIKCKYYKDFLLYKKAKEWRA
jgi:hypothetical protein